MCGCINGIWKAANRSSEKIKEINSSLVERDRRKSKNEMRVGEKVKSERSFASFTLLKAFARVLSTQNLFIIKWFFLFSCFLLSRYRKEKSKNIKTEVWVLFKTFTCNSKNISYLKPQFKRQLYVTWYKLKVSLIPYKLIWRLVKAGIPDAICDRTIDIDKYPPPSLISLLHYS